MIEQISSIELLADKDLKSVEENYFSNFALTLSTKSDPNNKIKSDKGFLVSFRNFPLEGNSHKTFLTLS